MPLNVLQGTQDSRLQQGTAHADTSVEPRAETQAYRTPKKRTIACPRPWSCWSVIRMINSWGAEVSPQLYRSFEGHGASYCVYAGQSATCADE